MSTSITFDADLQNLGFNNALWTEWSVDTNKIVIWAIANEDAWILIDNLVEKEAKGNLSTGLVAEH